MLFVSDSKIGRIRANNVKTKECKKNGRYSKFLQSSQLDLPNVLSSSCIFFLLFNSTLKIKNIRTIRIPTVKKRKKDSFGKSRKASRIGDDAYRKLNFHIVTINYLFFLSARKKFLNLEGGRDPVCCLHTKDGANKKNSSAREWKTATREKK